MRKIPRKCGARDRKKRDRNFVLFCFTENYFIENEIENENANVASQEAKTIKGLAKMAAVLQRFGTPDVIGQTRPLAKVDAHSHEDDSASVMNELTGVRPQRGSSLTARARPVWPSRAVSATQGPRTVAPMFAISLHFTGPPVPITARQGWTPHAQRNAERGPALIEGGHGTPTQPNYSRASRLLVARAIRYLAASRSY
eukprot:1189418-Prorocentrum_minimum.AAC.5